MNKEKKYLLRLCLLSIHANLRSVSIAIRDIGTPSSSLAVTFYGNEFARFTDRSGLRDTETTLTPCSPDLYRSSPKTMPKSTLVEANEKKDWHIYQDFA